MKKLIFILFISLISCEESTPPDVNETSEKEMELDSGEVYISLTYEPNALVKKYWSLGIEEDLMENYDEATRLYEKSIELASTTSCFLPMNWERIGLIKLKQKHYVEALDYFKKIIEFQDGPALKIYNNDTTEIPYVRYRRIVGGHLNSISVYKHMSKGEKAREHYEAIQRLLPKLDGRDQEFYKNEVLSDSLGRRFLSKKENE